LKYPLTVYIENNYRAAIPQDYQIDAANFTAIPWQTWFQTWLTQLSADLRSAQAPALKAGDGSLPTAASYELSLRLTSDREIQTWNSQYRQQDCPTDVLAFAALEDEFALHIDLDEPLYLGDIIISLDTACRQAISQERSPIIELAFLASHGLLHLLGWDHPDSEALERMLAKQTNLLQLIGINEVLLTC
jgi:probable rRNA maturation factor